MFAIFLIVANVHAIGFGDTFSAAGSFSSGLLLSICVALFIGAAAKSAQVPLHTWLPDAMEGPTPVSALIHAATMVTAGVYLIARCAPLWSHNGDAQELVGVIGGLTCLLGAILGTAQWDIKRILAYSTMSQIGYMIMGVGVGAYEGGVAHFFTHAFFKAQLFLGSGIIIHALANEQDVRRMGGLMKKMPFAFWAMLIGVFAICGVPGFSGFFSKDMVIYGTLQHGHPWLYAVGILTAGITAYYMFRLLFVTFLGQYRGDVDPTELAIHQTVPVVAGSRSAHETGDTGHHGHAPAWIMALPVAILMVPSTLIGWLMAGDPSPWSNYFATQFGTEVLTTPVISEMATRGIVLLFVIAGFAVAWMRYATRTAQANAVVRLRNEALRMPAILTHLFYFDAAIDLIFVRSSQLLGTLFGRLLDPQIVDGTVREVAFSARWLGVLVQSLQTGLVRAYALILVFGAACFIIYYAFAGGVLH
jgi:NADH-quinone oxidoreductase subunit L